jgi:hypothetical protein
LSWGLSWDRISSRRLRRDLHPTQEWVPLSYSRWTAKNERGTHLAAGWGQGDPRTQLILGETGAKLRVLGEAWKALLQGWPGLSLKKIRCTQSLSCDPWESLGDA